MPEEEILKKRAKLDESFIAATNPELSSGKKSRRSSVSTPNLPNRNVATPVREKWKDDLEAKGIQTNLDLRKMLVTSKIFLKSRFFLISNTEKSLKSYY